MNLIQSITVEQWSAEILLLIWGVAQSLILEYIPYVSEGYGKLDKKWKRFTQAIGLALVSVVVMLLACNDIVGGVACNQDGVTEFFLIWILGLMANQTTHLIAKRDGSQ